MLKMLLVLSLLALTSLVAGESTSEAAFPGDNGKIAFIRGLPYNVHVMNDDGSQQTNITNTTDTEFDPAWSPDGTSIAFTKGYVGDIYVMNADGSGQTNLTNTTDHEGDPAWSPDGAQLAFSRGDSW